MVRVLARKLLLAKLSWKVQGVKAVQELKAPCKVLLLLCSTDGQYQLHLLSRLCLVATLLNRMQLP